MTFYTYKFWVKNNYCCIALGFIFLAKNTLLLRVIMNHLICFISSSFFQKVHIVLCSLLSNLSHSTLLHFLCFPITTLKLGQNLDLAKTLPSKSFPINYSPIALPFDSMQSEILTILTSKPQKASKEKKKGSIVPFPIKNSGFSVDFLVLS